MQIEKNCIQDNCAFVLFCLGSMSNDHFSSLENSTKFKIQMSELITQIYKLSRAASRTAGHVVRAAMHSGNKWCSAVWLSVMHCGKKW